MVRNSISVLDNMFVFGNMFLALRVAFPWSSVRQELGTYRGTEHAENHPVYVFECKGLGSPDVGVKANKILIKHINK